MEAKQIKSAAGILALLCVFSIGALPQSGKKDYLERNHEVISLSGQKDFRLFDKEFFANDLFMVGEMHGTKSSYEFQKLFVEKLKRETDFRVYLLELSHIDAQNLNEYLDTGNEAILDKEFEDLIGSFGYSFEYRGIFTNIRRINNGLKKNQRIRFVGVDRFSGSNANFRFLSKVLRSAGYKKGPNLLLNDVYDAFEKELDGTRRFEIINDLKDGIGTDPQSYQKILDSRFWEFKLIVDNFHASLEIDKVRDVKPLSSQETDDVRDAQMASNFAALYKNLKLKDEKIFGYFGREHTYQEAGRRTNWMTARIKKAHPDLKIVTVSLRYMDSNFMIPTYFLEMQFGRKQENLFFYGGFQNDNSPFVKAVGINDLNEVKPDADAVLFKLNGEGSPYGSLPDLVDEIAAGKATTDYFEYALLMRNSKATTPISDKKLAASVRY